MSLLLAAFTTFTLARATDSAYADQAFPQEVVVEQAPLWQRSVPVVASAILPGTGQFLEGEWGKGLLHLGVSALCYAAMQLGASRHDANYQFIGGVGAIAIGIWSPWEAYLEENRPREGTPQ